ncbi:auxin-responsive protein IAA7-like [Curcuma longa]|uniref:auxin-responsive protein IAA7-like n=1 Tax=Curcuma longa TaxID=136217 RepID=UPI003D9F4CAD
MAEEKNPLDWSTAEEKKLELRLGLPGEGEDWSPSQEKGKKLPLEASLSLGHVSKVPRSNNFTASSATKREAFQQPKQLEFMQLQKAKEKACDALIQNSSHARITATPAVGWPPIRSFRKNLAGTPKLSTESPNESSKAAKKPENERKSLFVKINMDGIPIGRKVDLKAYDSYDKLSLAVDELFRGLMAAQMDPLALGTPKISEGEYTLAYEDDEGDRMLVGDVPWDMFVSTAKRLRVLKSSDLSASSLGAISRKRSNGS